MVTPSTAKSDQQAAQPGRARPVRARASDGAGKLREFVRLLRRTVLCALDDDVSNIAQSAAYSAIFALFPALIVAAAVVPMLPSAAPLRYELSTFFQRVLPTDVVPLLEGYFSPEHETAVTSVRALVVSILLSVLGCSGVIATLMEGLRRAYDLPLDCWTFVQRRVRALALVPLSLLPLAGASLLVVFGRYLSLLLARQVMPEMRQPMLLAAGPVRWGLALTGSVLLIALLYKLGTPLHQRWRQVLPGALLATMLWLTATLAFGLYVTRFANYSRVYGSLGAGVALLVWLFLVWLSVLMGAEFNGQLRAAQRERLAAAYGTTEGGIAGDSCELDTAAAAPGWTGRETGPADTPPV